MSGTVNQITDPSVPNNAEVTTLTIEKFNNEVHEIYKTGENLLADFDVEEVVGTDMVSNKYMSGGTLQVLVPGQDPDATTTEFNKNALVVDTTILARNYVNQVQKLVTDYDVLSRMASTQMADMNQLEDQMVIQQGLAGAFTGGVYSPTANTITGGVKRVADQGVAIKVLLNGAATEEQANDPYQLVSSIEIAILGLLIQKVPQGMLKIIVPLHEWSVLSDYGLIADIQGGTNEATGFSMTPMTGTLKGWGIPIKASVEFSQMKSNPHQGATHSLLSNAENDFRYDVTADMQKANALVYARDGLLCGRTIALQSDIFFDKKTKGWFADSWMREGCIPDRYDNLAVVASTETADNAEVLAKAKGKATATKSY